MDPQSNPEDGDDDRPTRDTTEEGADPPQTDADAEASTPPGLDHCSNNIQAEDGRVPLLKESYKEVLDATKHQDDKVGRLLTATAFLTAAALALANLVGGRALPRKFVIETQPLPSLAFLALVVFLVCVVFSVVFLLFSLSAPLKIPGFTGNEGLNREESPSPSPRTFSQIYFYSIAGASKDEWSAKWVSKNLPTLQADTPSMYVDETFNLAVRTDFKYNRTSEAVAVLTFGLLSFGAAILFVFAAATAPCTPSGSVATTTCTEAVELDLTLRVVLALLLAFFVFATLLTQLRSGRLAIQEAVGLIDFRRGWPFWRATAGRVYACTMSLAAALLILVLPERRQWLPASAIVMFFLGVAWLCLLPTYIGTRSRRGQGVLWSAHASFVTATITILVVVLLAWQGQKSGQYRYDLLAAVSIPAGIGASGLVGPTAQHAERRSRYRASLS